MPNDVSQDSRTRLQDASGHDKYLGFSISDAGQGKYSSGTCATTTTPPAVFSVRSRWRPRIVPELTSCALTVLEPPAQNTGAPFWPEGDYVPDEDTADGDGEGPESSEDTPLDLDAATALAAALVKVVKARDLAGQPDLLFRRNSQNGAVECKTNKTAIELNEALHAHN